jgi:hypothetical protein
MAVVLVVGVAVANHHNHAIRKLIHAVMDRHTAASVPYFLSKGKKICTTPRFSCEAQRNVLYYTYLAAREPKWQAARQKTYSRTGSVLVLSRPVYEATCILPAMLRKFLLILPLWSLSWENPIRTVHGIDMDLNIRKKDK